MGIEIEHKYKVKDMSFLSLAIDSKHIVQGYFKTGKGLTVRIRCSDNRAYLTIKGKPPKGSLARPEYEYEIPMRDAREMLNLFCGTVTLEKTRYYVPYAGFTWEVDVFEGRHKGLVLAEIELPSEDTEFDLPVWAGEDVSADKHYTNGYLAKN